jgi:hypothetical protein
LLKTLSNATGFGLALAAMVETAHADVPLPCWPCDDQIVEYNQECIANFGPGWTFCGDGPPWSDYFWCCLTN